MIYFRVMDAADLPDDLDALKAMLLVVRADAAHAKADAAQAKATLTTANVLIESL